ncbi:eukaryotic translation elongation factor 1 epsilon-1-like [Gigantopelta aegis]|uniref:eukaryotic translation elongation factor 1 epsilon-1-like n=1 Tax=Gigantopelta aegis TaxID=1735272 RepID=UPI001B88DCC5|nr:eukaryotic translation elongation factor 1 epsilon-1-like [Gigantopelta aegis]
MILGKQYINMSAIKEELQSVARYFGLSHINIVLDGGNKVPTIQNSGKTSVRGHGTIVKYLARTSHLDYLIGSDVAERAAIEQWLEYRTCFLDRCATDKDVTTILKELNMYLADKVYFVGHHMTLADIVLFHGLHCIVGDMTHQEKEIFMNVSRWFSNMQQNENLRQDLRCLNFQKTPIYLNCHH